MHSKLRYEAERYLEPESKHLCGIAYFRQVRDSSIHRGFYQKAVVILSHLPFHNLFRHLIDLTAPEYFTKGTARTTVGTTGERSLYRGLSVTTKFFIQFFIQGLSVRTKFFIKGVVYKDAIGQNWVTTFFAVKFVV